MQKEFVPRSGSVAQCVPPVGSAGILPVSLRGYADVTGDGRLDQADVDMLADAILGLQQARF